MPHVLMPMFSILGSTDHNQQTAASTILMSPVLTSLFVFHAVQGSQPENHALNQPTWSTTNSTTFQPSYLAVDGNAGSTAYIITEDVWPFLAVDLGARYNLNSISVGFYIGECLFALKQLLNELLPPRNGDCDVFISVGLFVFGLSVTNITEKQMNEISWNFQNRSDMMQGTFWNILAYYV